MAERGNSYVLAMYDVRGKQKYIYKSNKVKEIVGASWIIRDCFRDYLFPMAEAYGRENGAEKGIFNYRRNKDNAQDQQTPQDDAFSRENYERHLGEGYLGEVVYDGGGNFLVLFRDIETYRGVNRLFYAALLKATYSLQVLSTCLEGVTFDNYQGDRDKLYAKHRRMESRESAIHPVNALPIVQVDPASAMPLGAVVHAPERQKVSLESAAKYRKYDQVMKDGKDRTIHGAKYFDEMITQKGEDSHLAVIYIDGNNMGAQVEQCINGDDKSYETSIARLRRFSEEIQKYYIDKPMEKIGERLEEIYAREHSKNKGSGSEQRDADARKDKDEKKEKDLRRFLVYAGDEMTLVCNAKYAYAVVQAYFESLRENGGAGNTENNSAGNTENNSAGNTEAAGAGSKRTACAGIAIFKSHAPYSEAYRIAEECCESGKQWMKQRGLADICLMDFHYCQGAIGTSLEDIRAHEETLAMSRPWVVNMGGEAKRLLEEHVAQQGGAYYTIAQVEKMTQVLRGVNRSNSKALIQAAKKSDAAYLTERNRIVAHSAGQAPDFTLKGEKRTPAGSTSADRNVTAAGSASAEKGLDVAQQRALIYDIMMVYDLWADTMGGMEEA